MKVPVLLLSVVMAAASQELYSYPTPGGQGSQTSPSGSQTGEGIGSSGPPVGPRPFSTGNAAEPYLSVPAQYTYLWSVNDQHSGSFYGHREHREDVNTQGEYFVLLPDGRRLIVEYYADSTGYYPSIRYEGEAQYPSGPRQGSNEGYQSIHETDQGYQQIDPFQNQVSPQGVAGQGRGYSQGSAQGQSQGLAQSAQGPVQRQPSVAYLPPSS